MKKNYWIMMLCLLAGSFAGCSDDDDGPSWLEIFEKQQTLVADFVKDKSPLKVFDYPFEYNGKKLIDYAYLFEYDGNGVTPKPGQFILVNYTQRNLDGNILDSTYPPVAAGAKVTPYFEFGGPVYFQINDNNKYTDPTSEAWQLMAEGTTGSIILSSRMVASTTYLYREYKMEKIIQNESLLDYENELIDTYIGNKHVSEDDIIRFSADETNEDDTIARLVMSAYGEGQAVGATDSVTMWIEGEILDEFNSPLRKFMEMEKESSTVTMKVSDMPTKGLRMALVKLKENDEAELLLPSGMGFGYEGGFNKLTLQCSVPPYSTLLFKIKIKSTKPSAK